MFLANVELPVLIVYVVMVIGFIVMIWGIKNQNKQSGAKIIMIVGALMVFGAFAASLNVSGSKSENNRLTKNVHTFLAAKAEKAAEYISGRFPEGGSVAFLIDEASYNDSTSENYILLGELKNRLAEKGVSCEDELIVGLRKQVVDKKTGEENTVTDDPTDATLMKKQLDQVNDKVDIVINFVGLPGSLAEIRKITFLTRKNTATGKNNMLLFNDDGLPYVEQDMLRNGRICAIVNFYSTESENFDLKKNSAPKDLSKAFDLMYYFITPDTLSSFIADNPNYFITK